MIRPRLFQSLLALMLVASIIPTGMVGYRALSDTRELLARDAQELAQERVKQVLLKTEDLLEEPARAVVALAESPGFFALPLADQKMHIAGLLNARRELTAVTVFSARKARIPGLQAFAVADIPPTEVAEHESRAQRLTEKMTRLTYSAVYTSPSRAWPVVTVAVPVGDPLKGYVAAEISLSAMVSMLEAEKLGSHGFAYVVDDQGRLVAAPKALKAVPAGSDVSGRPAVAHLLETRAQSRSSSLVHVGTFGEDGDRVVGAYATLPELQWAVLSEQPLAQAYAQVGSMETRLSFGVLGAVLVALGLAWGFSRTLTRPLKGFMAGAMEIAKGNFGTQVPVQARNELGELAKTFNYMSLQISAYTQETTRLYESLEQGYLETIVALANSIDSKDAYTRGHSQRVGDVAVEIGRELKLTDRELKHLHYGGILHDIGKIGIAESILRKQSRLTDEEMLTMRDHPAMGDAIIEAVSFLAPVRSAVRSHHERWDGTGYPDKLKAQQIPLVARIVNCADTFDACTSTRPYQKAMPLERALEIMEGLRGTQLDPDVLDALRRVVQKKGVKLEGSGTPVKLAS